ncbi:MAG TPA: hypothetical protein VFB35_01325 [Gaiellaceae bacterium]|nr:hypothetical protein [Gaiellaceae bacterium]
MATGIDLVRHEWAAGYRRLQDEAGTPAHGSALQAQLDAISAELRRRVGDVYATGDLAAEYRRADTWVREVVADLPSEARWAPGLTIATDAAFHLFARRAQDFEP